MEGGEAGEVNDRCNFGLQGAHGGGGDGPQEQDTLMQPGEAQWPRACPPGGPAAVEGLQDALL